KVAFAVSVVPPGSVALSVREGCVEHEARLVLILVAPALDQSTARLGSIIPDQGGPALDEVKAMTPTMKWDAVLDVNTPARLPAEVWIWPSVAMLYELPVWEP